MKKAIVFLADGCEMVEALTPVDLLRRAGVNVLTVSINGKETIESSHKVTIKADQIFSEDVAADADMLILPGGLQGTLNLAAHTGVTGMVKDFFEQGRYVAAICAAPSVFGELGILKGKKAVCYPSFEEKLLGAEVSMEEVAVDGNVITSRGMGTAIPFGLALIEVLLGKKTAEKTRESVIYRV